MAVKPTNPIIRIAESDVVLPIGGIPNKTPPTGALLTVGYDEDGSFAADHFNYITDNIGGYLQYLVDSIDENNTVISDLQQQITDNKNTIDKLIPSVGEIYHTESTENPADKFGVGTWTLIEESFLVGYQSGDPDFGTVGGTGGVREHSHAATTTTTTTTTVQDHVLTEAELPSHQHALPEGGADNAVYGTTTDSNILVEDWNNETTTSTRSLTKAVGGDQGHDHGATSSSSSSTSLTVNSNLPPYRVVYIWRRTA